MAVMPLRLFINRHDANSQSDKILVAFVLLCLCVAHSAFAQISGNVTVVTEYRYRGVSLSEGDPEGQLSLGYDNAAGWYAGGLVSGVRLYDLNTEQFIVYGGYTKSLFSGLSIDGGVSNTTFRRASDYNYNEAYIGVTSDRYSARLYYSPSYFYQNARTLYGELNVPYTITDNVQLLAHIGLLHHLTDNDSTETDLSTRYDYRIGLNTRVSDWNFQIALVGLQKKSNIYEQYVDRHLHTWLLSTSYSF